MAFAYILRAADGSVNHARNASSSTTTANPSITRGQCTLAQFLSLLGHNRPFVPFGECASIPAHPFEQVVIREDFLDSLGQGTMVVTWPRRV